MADKDVTVSVSGGGAISVNPDPVELKKSMDQAKWTCTTPGLQNMAIEFKDGSYSATCSAKGADTWECKSKKFDADGTYPYSVTLVINGTTRELDPDLIVKP